VDIDKIHQRAGALIPQCPEVALPVLDVQDGCGYVGDQRVIVQVVLANYKGKAKGCGVADGFIRLEVVRMCPIADYKPGPVWERRVKTRGDDPDHRVDSRLTLRLDRRSPRGFEGNLKPWLSMTRSLVRALEWAIKRTSLDRDKQYGLLLVVDITEPRAVSSNGFTFDEAHVTAVLDGELVALRDWTLDDVAGDDTDNYTY
jgi:hypothetical protein